MTPEHLTEMLATIIAVAKAGGSEGLKRVVGDGYEVVRDRLKESFGKGNVRALPGPEGQAASAPENTTTPGEQLSASFDQSEPGISYQAAVGYINTHQAHGVALEALPLQIRDTANRHLAILRGIRSLSTQPASTRALLNRAYGTLLNASSSQEYDEADALLLQVQETQTSDMSKAVILAERAQLKFVRLEYQEAATDLQQASEWIAEHSPELKADYLFSAATALRYHGDETGDNASLSHALDLYREVLEIAGRECDPAKLAEFRSQYWNTLQTLGEREGAADRIEEALSYNLEALQFYDRRRESLEWALTKNNIGNALLAIGERESGLSRLEEALAAYDEAISIYTRKSKPLLRASVYNNKGVALQVLGERKIRNELMRGQGVRHLKEAVTNVRRALKYFERTIAALDWAMAQVSLGNALVALGEVEDSLPQIKQGLARYESALEEYTRASMALHWAGTRNNIGRALQSIAEREGGFGLLRAAEGAYKEALKENKRERAPLDWAMMKNNLGNVLQIMSDRGIEKEATLTRAIEAYRDSLKEFTPKHTPEQCSAVRSNLDIALVKFANVTAETEPLHVPDSSRVGSVAGDRSLPVTRAKELGNHLALSSRFWVLKGVAEH